MFELPVKLYACHVNLPNSSTIVAIVPAIRSFPHDYNLTTLLYHFPFFLQISGSSYFNEERLVILVTLPLFEHAPSHKMNLALKRGCNHEIN